MQAANQPNSRANVRQTGLGSPYIDAAPAAAYATIDPSANRQNGINSSMNLGSPQQRGRNSSLRVSQPGDIDIDRFAPVSISNNNVYGNAGSAAGIRKTINPILGDVRASADKVTSNHLKA